MIFRSITLIVTGILLSTAQPARAMVSNVLLEDFEGGPGDTASGARVTTANSSSTGDSFSSVPDNVLEGGSNRLRFQDPGGTRNGITFTIPNAFTEGGNYLITADVKVDNSSDPVVTMGIAGRVGGTSTAKIDDRNAGYVMNLEQYPTTAASLGYQTVGLAIQVPTAGPFPQSLTLYVSTDPSGNTFGGWAHSGFVTFR